MTILNALHCGQCLDADPHSPQDLAAFPHGLFNCNSYASDFAAGLRDQFQQAEHSLAIGQDIIYQKHAIGVVQITLGKMCIRDRPWTGCGAPI